MFEWIAFLIALIATAVKFSRKEIIGYMYVIVATVVSAFIALIITFIGGILFPAEAIMLTRESLIPLLLDYFFSAFIGALILPICAWIATIKVE